MPEEALHHPPWMIASSWTTGHPSGAEESSTAPCGGVHDGSLVNCVLFGNRADYAAGAMSATMINCTVVSNVADGSVGGVSHCVVTNSVVYHNSANRLGRNYQQSTLEHSCTTPMPSGIGNTTNDPEFVDLSATNLRFLSTSPCIDSGTNMASMIGAADLDGLPRIINGTVDMGAYESPSPAITSISPPALPVGPVITWASFSNAEYAVYGSSNLIHGYDILLQEGLPAHPPENAFTDTVTGVALQGYVVEYTP